MRQWKVHYSVSEDGGKTDLVNEQIVHAGEAFDEIHHLPGVVQGKNSVMIGDLGQRPLIRTDGVMLVPVQSSPAGPDGVYHNPGGVHLHGLPCADGYLAERRPAQLDGLGARRR